MQGFHPWKHYWNWQHCFIYIHYSVFWLIKCAKITAHVVPNRIMPISISRLNKFPISALPNIVALALPSIGRQTAPEIYLKFRLPNGNDCNLQRAHPSNEKKAKKRTEHIPSRQTGGPGRWWWPRSRFNVVVRALKAPQPSESLEGNIFEHCLCTNASTTVRL